MGLGLAAEGFAVLSYGETPTREHRGYPSHIDITLVNNEAAVSTVGWRVMDEEESGSDHHYIFFHVKQTGPPENITEKNTKTASKGARPLHPARGNRQNV